MAVIDNGIGKGTITLSYGEKFEGELQVVKSPRPYQYKLNLKMVMNLCPVKQLSCIRLQNNRSL